ncbi:MAG: hypothetical protein ACE5MK_09240, partial [Acidobacteriota bacterium]
IRSACRTDEGENGAVAFILESVRLPALTVKEGPKVFSEGNSSRFLERNRRGNLVWVGNDGRITALTENKFTDATLFLKFLLGTKKINSSGISKGLISDMKKRGVRIYKGKSLRRGEGFTREVVNDLVTTDQFAFGTA